MSPKSLGLLVRCAVLKVAFNDYVFQLLFILALRAFWLDFTYAGCWQASPPWI